MWLISERNSEIGLIAGIRQASFLAASLILLQIGQTGDYTFQRGKEEENFVKILAYNLT